MASRYTARASMDPTLPVGPTEDRFEVPKLLAVLFVVVVLNRIIGQSF
jgi:hypothetical protein